MRRTETLITPFIARNDLLIAAAQQPDGNNEILVYRIGGSSGALR